MFYSDKFQEYKQKHLERKAAAVKELGLKLNSKFAVSVSETVNGRQKSSAFGCGEEAEDGGSAVMERTAVVSASEHVVQPVEQLQHEEKEGAIVALDAEVKMANGEAKPTAAAQETETSVPNVMKSSTANGKIKTETKCDEKNGETNGSGVITANASAFNSKGTWADVVSKTFVANGSAVNGVTHKVSANGTAEE